MYEFDSGRPAARMSSRRQLLGLSLLCAGLACSSPVRADDAPGAGTSAGETATIVRRDAANKAWHAVAKKEVLHAGEMLIGMPGASIDSKDGAVRLFLMSDLDDRSPYPVRECGVQLMDAKDCDMELTLDRGRIDLLNRKASGPANVRVHVRDTIFDLALAEPGTDVALELYGRWPRGAKFKKNPGPKDVPHASLVIVVLHGHANLKHDQHEIALKAPPGNALIEWDNVSGLDESARHLEKLPPWAAIGEVQTEAGKVRQATLERFREAVQAKPIEAVLEDFLNSDKPAERRLAVVAMGAIDDLPRLGAALREAKHPDVWENGVLALRHWIGRCPGQDQVLYNRLLERKIPAVQAETIVQLLHSYDDNELASPELYQTLIDYMDHAQLAIRGLAYWHLVRLVPSGKAIGYDPLASQEARDAAVKKWRELVPPHTVPGRQKQAEGD